MTDIGPWARIIVRHPNQAFGSSAKIAKEWRNLGYLACPDLSKAADQFDTFVTLLSAHAPVTLSLTASDELSLDSTYVRDASIMSSRGAILCRMGKPQRAAEPAALIEAEQTARLRGEGLEKALASLDARSRRIVEERWLKVNDNGSGGMTLHDLADEYGVSAERIRQIEVAAMKKMKKALVEFA